MTCGIYALYWEEQDLIYIGLSQNIEDRFKEHIRDMVRGNHSNYLIQGTYFSYGKPSLTQILEECIISELNSAEVYWTKAFSALKSKVGLCLIEPGNNVYGTNSRNSKYTRRQILKVFSLLYKSTIAHKDVAKRAKVPKNLVDDIACRSSHLWLRESYPDKYRTLLENKDTRYTLRNTYKKSYPCIVSPEGTEFNIQNLGEFCREHDDFNSNPLKVSKAGISRVLNKTRKSYLGWKLK